MADKTVEQPEVPEVVEETEKDKKEVEEETPEVEEESKTESENGQEEKKENGATNGDSTPLDKEEDKCCIKRKSTGGDATEDKAVDGATPEKKAKLDEPAEAESNGAEVAA